MKIKILNDYGEVYDSGTIMTLDALKRDYEEANWVDNEDTIAWDGWSEIEILDFIADAWGIDYEIIKLTTRVEVDVPEDFDVWDSDSKAFEDIVSEARDNILDRPFNYLYEENAEVREDTECPYDGD